MLESYGIFVINTLCVSSLQTPHQFGRTTQILMGSCCIEIQCTQTLQVINYIAYDENSLKLKVNPKSECYYE